MTTRQKQSTLSNLKNVLSNFSSIDKKLVGVSIIRENSSENWLFNTNVDINEIVPVVTKALEKEIAQLEEELAPILEQEAKDKAIQDEIDRIAEEERLKQEQAAAEIQAIRDQRKLYQQIGSNVIEQYLYDNSLIVLDAQQTLQQLKKFSDIKELLELGSLRVAKELLAAAEVDDVFTQDRKDKYLTMLTR